MHVSAVMTAWHGMAWHGMAWHDMACPLPAGHGSRRSSFWIGPRFAMKDKARVLLGLWVASSAAAVLALGRLNRGAKAASGKAGRW